MITGTTPTPDFPAPDNVVRPNGGAFPSEARTVVLSIFCGALCLLVVFRPFFTSHFDRILSDRGDGRFCIVILEHWTRVFRGLSPMASPMFFFPERGVLGYSDALFLYALPYSLMRALSVDRYVAFELTIMLVTAIGYASMLWLLRRLLRFAEATSLLGAALFTMSNVYYVQIVHAQLAAVGFVPLLLVLTAQYWGLRNSRLRLARIYLCVSGLLLAALLFTSFYIGWFAIVFCATGLILFAVCITWADRTIDVLAQGIKELRSECLNLLLGATAFLVGLIPFFIVYLPALARTRGRSLQETLYFMVPFLSVLDVGRYNLIWGGLAQRIEGIIGPAELHEHPAGWPLLTVCIFLASVVYCLFRLTRFRSAPAAKERRRLCFILALGLTCLILLLITSKYGRHAPLWYPVWKSVPGATAIRVPQRINLVLTIGALGVCMFGLEKLIGALFSHRLRTYAVALLLGAVLLGEQLNSMETHAISRAEEARKFSKIPPPPKSCSAFFASDWSTDLYQKIVIQTDAMLVSQRFGIPTMDGYSGWSPEGWDLWDARQHTTQQAIQWAVEHHLTNGVCSLDLQSGTWLPVDLARVNPAEQPVKGVIANSGFEDEQLSSWMPYQDVRGIVSTTKAYRGTHSLAEIAGVGSYYQDLTGLESGQTYRISAWISSSPGSTASAQIAVWDPGTNKSTFSPVRHPSQSWILLTTWITASPSGSVRLHLFRNGGSGTIYWDDIQIAREH